MAIRMTGINSGLDTEAIIEQLMEAQTMKKTKVEDKKTKLEWKQEKWKDLNTKLYKLYTGTLSKAKSLGNYNQKKVNSTNEKAVTATADPTASNGANTVEVKELASSQYVTGSKISGVLKTDKLETLGITNGTSISFKSKAGTADEKEVILTVDENTTINDFVAKAKEAGLNANYDEGQGRFFINSSDSGVENKFSVTTSATITRTEGETTVTSNALTALGLDNIDGSAVTGGTGMTVVAAKDSRIILNGAELTSSSNTITANGISMTLNSVTAEGEKVNIGVTNDTDAVYGMVKDFLKEYNGIIKEMNTLYSAASARDYSVLTDKQKEDMSDDEIEKWETKIKDSLLRRDSTLDSILSTMKTAMQAQATTSDGKKYSLASFGISTSTDYTEKGLLHIFGDSDDDTYSTETNKLKKMLESDPNAVAESLSSIFSGLYQDLQDKMSATSLSSALTFYNDKEITSQLKDYKDEISDWDDYLTDMEDKYYKQFSAMETAMSKLNSQSSYLSGLFSS